MEHQPSWRILHSSTVTKQWIPPVSSSAWVGTWTTSYPTEANTAVLCATNRLSKPDRALGNKGRSYCRHNLRRRHDICTRADEEAAFVTWRPRWCSQEEVWIVPHRGPVPDEIDSLLDRFRIGVIRARRRISIFGRCLGVRLVTVEPPLTLQGRLFRLLLLALPFHMFTLTFVDRWSLLCHKVSVVC